MGQPTNPLFNRLGNHQSWFVNWVASPAKYYYAHAVKRDWVISRLLILYMVYGLVLPRENLWLLKPAKRGMVSTRADYQQPSFIGRGGSFPVLDSPSIRGRYYRQSSIFPGDFSSPKVLGRAPYFFDLVYTRVCILQYCGWLVLQWGFFKPRSVTNSGSFLAHQSRFAQKTTNSGIALGNVMRSDMWRFWRQTRNVGVVELQARSNAWLGGVLRPRSHTRAVARLGAAQVSVLLLCEKRSCWL